MLHYEFKKRVGKPIVFLHGLGEDHSIFNHQINYLDGLLKSTLAVDLEGHGRSLLTDGKTSIPRQAESLDRVLTTEKIPKVDLVGFSLGGAVALEYATKHPNKVDYVCLINPALYNDYFLTLQVKLVRNVLEIVKGFAKNDNSVRDKPADLSGAMFSNAHYSFLNGLRATSAAGLYANIHALMDYGVPKNLSEVNTDTLIIRSDDDELIKEEVVNFLDKELSYSKIIKIPGKHVVMLDNKEEINKILEEFLC
ncbi:alpha/beta hydrolase [Candidatus Woesearchaeota archaeon]|jgi:(E)-2-((N-methylformamido)methylene)succinate hydrolase|nr:alpha/beta hydrolase [Candidatus Woesearchaeota archaeon]MBT5342692.1 alpha/beta hydrolase [Candidatus Woesearchaeota archaeon]MBT6774789.1 alpha/beta hydrolase [Candidatus Woesearchaeota archaeon]